MAWERRGNQQFYYRSRKINGRVVRSYLGRGEQANRAALEDAQKKATREHNRAERQEWEAMDSHIAQLHQLTKLLTYSRLVNAGWYQHHRGEWRRRGDYDGLDRGIGHFMFFEVDSEVLAQAPPIPKSPQTLSVASD